MKTVARTAIPESAAELADGVGRAGGLAGLVGAYRREHRARRGAKTSAMPEPTRMNGTIIEP